MEWLIEKHIEEYEKEHGEIKTLVTITTDKDTNFTEKAKESFNLGFEKGTGKKQRLKYQMWKPFEPDDDYNIYPSDEDSPFEEGYKKRW
ncbi:MAG: hypothetical protein HFH93_04690 [Lachnospiraceae bacterium]|nr:hypothetical protein [Lachnospiraceae bacterium]